MEWQQLKEEFFKPIGGLLLSRMSSIGKSNGSVISGRQKHIRLLPVKWGMLES
jgi:hypothetical protein